MKRLALAALTAALVVVIAAPVRAAQTLSADGRTATDGTRALGVSAVKDLNPDGEIVTVDGRGYNPNKGFYIAFCVQPAPGQKPSPCGGGDDRDGASGSSIWLSNELTSRAQGSTAMNADGSFHVRMVVKAVMDGLNIDCRKTKCAVVTRNDHTRPNDRSQDLVVPVTFRATAATTTTPGQVTTTLPPVKLPPSTTTTLAPELTAPVTVVDTTGRSVNGGGKTLSADVVHGLTTDQKVRVRGQGYDASKGVYVSLCAIANTVTEPGPCGSGSAGASAWVSSNPPDYGKSRAIAYASGGAFDVSITVDPLIDADHDCRVILCAIATRNDDTHQFDRSQDLFLPVTFSAAPETTTTLTPSTVAGVAIAKGGQSSTPYEIAFGAMVVGGLGLLLVARLRARTGPIS